jgi:hypothetical protein
MIRTHKPNLLLLCALSAAIAVYIFAHWESLWSPWVVNDDVRQQVYWMQKWQDHDLYQNDILSQYAQNYVPYGVQAVYFIVSDLINPLQFTKVLTAILFVVSAGLMFSLTKRLSDGYSGLFAVCLMFLFGTFLGNISGGLSRAFVFPLMLAYLYFFSLEKYLAACLVIMIQALFNPYLFLLCTGSQIIFLFHFLSKTLPDPGLGDLSSPRNILSMFLLHTPLMAGGAFMGLKYVFFKSPLFGDIVTRTDMLGKAEYTAAGRFEILPVPSVFFELLRPFVEKLPLTGLGIAAGVLALLLIGILFVQGFIQNKMRFDFAKLQIFIYLFAASVLLFFLSNFLLLKLFIPSRYMEYSIVIIYCVSGGILLKSVIFSLENKKIIPVIAIVLIILGAFRLQGVGIYDYSKHETLYRFLEKTPINSLIAGHPKIMDNIITFSKRKAFVTFELSHPWAKKYWEVITPRTYDFFRAYYASDPGEVKAFCINHKIEYLVIRDEDYRNPASKTKQIYFEPFGGFIQHITQDRIKFAVLDEKIFKPVYKRNGIRVLRPALEKIEERF